MSPTLAKAATVSAVLALTLGVTPALAGDPRPGPATPQTPAAPAVRTPATAAVRATYERMDPLARSLFWTGEMEINPADPGPPRPCVNWVAMTRPPKPHQRPW